MFVLDQKSETGFVFRHVGFFIFGLLASVIFDNLIYLFVAPAIASFILMFLTWNTFIFEYGPQTPSSHVAAWLSFIAFCLSPFVLIFWASSAVVAVFLLTRHLLDGKEDTYPT